MTSPLTTAARQLNSELSAVALRAVVTGGRLDVWQDDERIVARVREDARTGYFTAMTYRQADSTPVRSELVAEADEAVRVALTLAAREGWL
jgi:hypothetical protein